MIEKTFSTIGKGAACFFATLLFFFAAGVALVVGVHAGARGIQRFEDAAIEEANRARDEEPRTTFATDDPFESGRWKLEAFDADDPNGWENRQEVPIASNGKTSLLKGGANAKEIEK